MSMDELTKPIALTAGYQKYAWGDLSFIPELFGFAASGEPYAEAWLGAHPRLPSAARIGAREVALDALLREHGTALLGPSVERRFAGLPFLLKVLAAEKPLSIQVHPTRAQAELGFERENAQGVALNAPTRNYRDRNHKPELIVALTPFFALCGFRPLGQIRGLLNQVPELGRLLPPLDDRPGSLARFVERYLMLAEEPRGQALSAWIERLRAGQVRPSLHGLDHWVLTAHAATEQAGTVDRGLFFLLLLNLLELQPGQGLFLSAGVPHAYLKGAGVEVMANSDNVLRCGLTTKHTDDSELLAVVRFESNETPVLEPVPGQVHEVRRFATAVEEFRLEQVALPKGRSIAGLRAAGPEIVLVTSADAEVAVRSVDPDSELVLRGGGACFIPHGISYSLLAASEASLVRVTVPDA